MFLVIHYFIDLYLCCRFFQKNENTFIGGYKEEIAMLKTRVTELKGVEKHLKASNIQVTGLEARIAELTKELEVCEEKYYKQNKSSFIKIHV